MIEDDVDLRAAAKALLEANGYTIVAVGDGREALRRLRDGETPALILFDLRMPVMDGARFRVAQVRDPSLRSIPVVVVSGESAARRSAVFDGVPFYQKPLDGDALLHIVARHASRSDAKDVRIEVRDVSIPRARHREVRGRPLIRGRSRGRR